MPETAGHAVRNPQYPASSFELLADLASQLIGIPRHLSVHVGGMLVTAQPLVEVVPLEHATKPGVVVAQWNKDSVEDAGLVKIDLLSLATLSMVSEACALIEQRYGVKPDLDALPLDDPAVYRLLAEGDAIGCFPVESRAQSSMLPRLKPQRFEDLVIEVAIVRPGPIQGGMVNPYLRRRQGLEPVTYLHPSLEPALRETLGVVVFQEQVIRVAIAVAGFTPGEADLLRRAMSRSRSAEAMAALRARFLAGARANGVEAAVAEEVFTQLQGFATYGFCKSHAASFALIAYQTLWLKAHYPAEFYCALLNHQPMGFYSPEVIAGDARRHGITVLRPDVNQSEDGCTLEQGSGGAGEQGSRGAEGQGSGGAGKQGRREVPLLPGPLAPSLRLGLRYLSGLGDAGRARLLAARGDRAFGDPSMESGQALADFCRRTRLPRPLVGDLIRAGALDGFGGSRRQLLWALGGLQYREEALIEAPDTPAELPDLTEQEAMGWDYELLGLSPDDHPLRLLRSRLRSQGVLSAAELSAQPSGKVVKVAGMVVVRQAPPTAKGCLFITLEDETGLINLVIRPDLYERERPVLHKATLLLGEGRVQREGAAISLLVQRVTTLRQPG
jgi:error-prone DNA polymerase